MKKTHNVVIALTIFALQMFAPKVFFLNNNTTDTPNLDNNNGGQCCST